jgi:hypothetical protein
VTVDQEIRTDDRGYRMSGRKHVAGTVTSWPKLCA